MHGESDNPKMLLTRLRILKTIDKPIEKCTIDEICSKAGISRQTFYNTFNSKYEIVSWWSECSEKLFLDKIGIDYSWEEGTLRHLRFLLSKTHMLSFALANKSAEVQREVSQRRCNRMMRLLHERGVEVDELLSFCVDSYALDLTRVATEYVNVPKEKRPGLIMLAKMLVSLVPAPLYEAMRLPGDEKRSQPDGIAEIEQLANAIGNEPEPDTLDLLLQASESH